MVGETVGASYRSMVGALEFLCVFKMLGEIVGALDILGSVVGTGVKSLAVRVGCSVGNRICALVVGADVSVVVIDEGDVVSITLDFSFLIGEEEGKIFLRF